MAQTRRKRQTKHRGNAAGVIESRGRTGRTPTPAEKRGEVRTGAKTTRTARFDRPPTWRGAFWQGDARGDRAAVVVIALLHHHKQRPRSCCSRSCSRYIPISYYTDQWMYHRRQRSEAKQGGGGRRLSLMSALDVRAFTVGPVQENATSCGPAPTRRAR